MTLLKAHKQLTTLREILHSSKIKAVSPRFFSIKVLEKFWRQCHDSNLRGIRITLYAWMLYADADHPIEKWNWMASR